jgi:hypothetical protein
LNAPEKRSGPRVKTGAGARAEGKTVEIIDAGEGGLAFISSEKIISPVFPVRLVFSGREFALDARMVWKTGTGGGKTTCGVEFVNLGDSDRAGLRKEIIREQIRGLLARIRDPKLKKNVGEFFLKDVLEYTGKVINFASGPASGSHASHDLQTSLQNLNTEIILKGNRLEERLADRAVSRRVKADFRALVSAWIYRSPVIRAAFEKPRGHAGDYLTLEAIYHNRPAGEGISGYYERYFLNSPYAVAVRFRKKRVEEMLLDSILSHPADAPARVLSLACGPCRDIAELAPRLPAKRAAAFTCVDSDADALEFSKKTLQGLPRHITADFLQRDLRAAAKRGLGLADLPPQDIIYSIGLIDYLPGRIFVKCLRSAALLAAKGGRMIFTHINRDKTFPQICPDWFCDWHFVPRNEREVTALLRRALPDFSLEVSEDDFGFILYFILTQKR